MMNLPLHIDFSGKVVVVTGAGGVLCGTMARAFAQSGAKVAALDLNEDAVKKLAEECRAEGFCCEGCKANVLDPDALKEVHAQVLAGLGPCDILVNGAGGNNPRASTDNEYQHEAKESQKTFFDLEASGVDFVFKLNFQGTLLPTQAFARAAIRLHPEYFLHERVYAADENSRVFRRKGGDLQLYPMAGNTFRGERNPLQRDCTRFPGWEPEPQPAVQPGWHADRPFAENPGRDTGRTLRGKRRTVGRRILPL